MSFPTHRPRRLRRNEALRGLVRETKLSVSSMVYPLFACPGTKVRTEVSSMPGIFQQSVDQIVEECREVADLGIPAIILFGLPEHKDELASEAYDANGAVQRSIEAIEDVHGVLFEQPHQAVRLLDRPFDRLLALDGGDVGGDEPARGNQDQTCNSSRMQESPHPEQPFAAHDHFSKAPRRKRATRACFIAPGQFNPSLHGHFSAWRS